ncbi:TSL-kinase interacting protein 1 [Malania oleifera]|uniref:TSL-kinase interacting protein 1 n=1 Tax=Malania oleifera TaxID=397392 RepID=UPI0025AE77A3|nr:TSL-kinase interacting protein 1 [Malania oleifera]
MQTESQVSLGCEACLQPENISIKDGDPTATSSAINYVVPQQPAKKQTRQWAAWTRQEEESFFTALRQVGKNFEKITCRVQSKNKDQVRHYYYRLVRRMNKLLGPGFCLDAKNSKDTNAAMLRWWSLLEKYSCKASKLHLKPRRFKIFIEALEHQLLKDRKKNKRKRRSAGENCPPSVAANASNHSRATGHDPCAVKLVLVDSQNIQKLGPGKGSSLRRNVNVGINRNNKGDSSAVKTGRRRRKPGPVSSAAYKRWEKAAIAGVSLVADAAEHLERTATDKEVEHDQCTLAQKGFDPVAKAMLSLPFSNNLFTGNNVQTSMKLKLQLFPIDEGTRRALEMDKHNPHLELTLSVRKKISSVLDHLSRKWGNSSIASGELMLFPYSVQRENLVGYPRWTQDSIASAADVHVMIGSPPIFRLRYGWFSITDVGYVNLQSTFASCFTPGEHTMNINYCKAPTVDSIPVSAPPTDHRLEKPMDSCRDQATIVAKKVTASPSTGVPDEMIGNISMDPNKVCVDSSDSAENISCQTKVAGVRSITRQMEDADDMRKSNAPALSAGEWADSLTNISVGDLLSEVSREMDANCVEPPLPGGSLCLQQLPFSCDSFDAAIAAHISRQQEKTGCQSALVSHASSIWDAEETCDAFSFQKNSVIHKEGPSLSRFASLEACKQIARTSSVGSGTEIKDLPEAERTANDPAGEGLKEGCHSDPLNLDNAAKDLSGLTDIYWPDSLGLLDLDIPCSRYHSDDMILSDSLSGLNRLIASSLDAFQNCSFFGLDKKELASTVEDRETASFSDFKIGSGV